MDIVIKISNISAIFILAFMMIFGTYNQVADPEFYDGFIPDFFPKLTVNYISAIVKLIIGVLIILPNWRRLGSLLFIGLMVAFFPIHIWDLLKDVPAIGSKQLAMIRLVVQFIFIGIAYFVFKRTKLMTKSDTNA
jgi:uncharacterized membrane protein